MPTSILKEQYIRNSEVISMHTDLKSCQSTQMNLLGDFYVFFYNRTNIFLFDYLQHRFFINFNLRIFLISFCLHHAVSICI